MWTDFRQGSWPTTGELKHGWVVRKFLARHPRLRGVLAIGGGTLAGQLILLAVTPILSRLYTPEAFGAFSTLIAIVSIVGSVAALKFDAGIVLPEEERDAATVTRMALFCAGLVSVISAGVLWALELLGLGESWSSIFLAPVWMAVLAFLTALATILTQVALRGRAYAAVARRPPIQSGTTALVQVGMGFVAPGPVGLVTGTAVGNAAGLTPMVRMTRQLLREKGGSWRQMARRFWRLPSVLAPSALLNTLGSQVPLLAIAGLFGASVVGEFGMAYRIVYIPATLIGTAVAQVFAAELAKHLREGGGGATRIYLRASGALLLIALPVGAAVAGLGPWALPPILGPQWELVGDFCLPLAFIMALSLIASPTSQVYIIFQSAASLVMDAARLILLAAAIIASVAWQLGPVEAVWALAIAQAIGYLLSWSYGIRVTRNSLR